MSGEHEIIRMVYAAKEDIDAANRLAEKYLPFIKSETAKYIKRAPVEGRDDELSIAMFAFYEATLSYEKTKGAFFPYASRGIRNRLIDYSRKEQRHTNVLSLHSAGSDEEDSTLLEKLDSGIDEIHMRMEQSAAKEEILHFTKELASFGLCLTDVADNCPKQERTLTACHRVLTCATENPKVFDTLLETKKLPISLLAEKAKVEKKTLERHRKYIVAILLAYTNGFEIIRGHLKQTKPRKGGRTV